MLLLSNEIIIDSVRLASELGWFKKAFDMVEIFDFEIKYEDAKCDISPISTRFLWLFIKTAKTRSFRSVMR